MVTMTPKFYIVQLVVFQATSSDRRGLDNPLICKEKQKLSFF